jgi:hypothetical protein
MHLRAAALRLSIAGLTCTALMSLPVRAQTIRPVVSEYRNKARGAVELVNNGDRPLAVVLEAKGFTVSETGEISYQPLPDHIHLKLSGMSVQIPARQSRHVFYEATVDRSPAWFVLYANVSGYSPRDFGGLNVQLELPHTIYVLPKQTLQKADIRVRLRSGGVNGSVVLDVENVGPNFGRIAGIELRSGRKAVTAPGFPLYPHSHRLVEFAWTGEEPPDRAVLTARGFSMEETLAREHE